MSLRSLLVSGILIATVVGVIAVVALDQRRMPSRDGHPARLTTPETGTRSEAELIEAVNRDAVTLVKFGATWCGPCHTMDANLEKVAGRLPAGVQTRRIDTDEHPELSAQFNVSTIPHTFLFKNGEVLDHTVGVLSGDEIVDWVTRYQ